MAGTLGAHTQWKIREILATILLVTVTASDSLQCLDQSGNPVDWFIIYKLPHNHELPDDSFYYMDGKQPHWKLSDTTLKDTHGQAIYNTLQQIYSASFKGKADRKRNQEFNEKVLKWRSSRFILNGKDKNESQLEVNTDILFAMYNDDLPEKKTLKFQRSGRYSQSTGHTKGVIGFDQTRGFWLIHSTPKFPPKQADGYQWASNANRYAQSFLCISMATGTYLAEIGKQFEYNHPHIYDKNVPKSLSDIYPNIEAELDGKHVTSPPWNRKTSLLSLAGKQFFSYAKSKEFDADLYSTWIAPDLGNTILVESWQNGVNKLCSNCTGKFRVYNVNTLLFKEESTESFKETQDHAKWAVTNSTLSGAWTCIGDINRQESQLTRGGGTVCTNDQHIWSAFRSLIATFHDCSPYKKCVEG